jgi:hypothetical protein
MEEQENLAPQIEKLLDELEVLGYNRKKVAEANNYKLKTFTTTLRRGGNQKMLNKIAFYKQTIEQMKLNPDFDILKRVERIEKMQDILLTAICDLLARQTQRSSAIIKSEYEKLINEPNK